MYCRQRELLSTKILWHPNVIRWKRWFMGYLPLFGHRVSGSEVRNLTVTTV